MDVKALRRAADMARGDAEILEHLAADAASSKEYDDADVAAVERCSARVRGRAEAYEAAIPLAQEASHLRRLTEIARDRGIGEDGRLELAAAVAELESRIAAGIGPGDESWPPPWPKANPE